MKIRNTLIGAALALPLMTGMVFAGDSYWRQTPGSGNLTTTNGIPGSYNASQGGSPGASTVVQGKGSSSTTSQAYAAFFAAGRWVEAFAYGPGNKQVIAARSLAGATASTWQGRIQNQ
jgi:hypothetical protein